MKAQSPIVASPSGKDTAANEEQLAKARYPIVDSPSGKDTAANEEQR